MKNILESGMSTLNSRRAFARIRNAGIMGGNKIKAMENGDAALFERINNGSSTTAEQAADVHCTVCNGCYSSKYFYRHKLICKPTNSSEPAKPVLASLLNTSESDDFTDLLNRFQANDIGNTCRTDQTIILIGRYLWQKDRTKVDKHDEVRKSVMSDMRNLAKLYLQFKLCLSEDQNSTDAADMFSRENWKALQEAITNVTRRDAASSETQIKYGLKNTLYYLIVKAADILEGEALAQKGKEEYVQEIRNFSVLLKHHQNSLFGDSKYMIN